MSQPIDPFAQLLNVEYLESSFEKTVCQLTLKDEHYNALGTPHGAVIFALADFSFARACNSDDGKFIGIQTEIRYMNQAQGKKLIATANLCSSSRKIAHYQVEIRDQLNTAVALFTATAYRVA